MEVARRFTRRLHELPSEELELIAGLFVRREVHKGEPVSYTHLTLPTICSV